MDEASRREEARIFHQEARKRALQEWIVTARWTLAAAAAATIACLNALVSQDVDPATQQVLTGAMQGYVASMALSMFSLQRRNYADTKDMILWWKLDRPCEEVPPTAETTPEIKKIERIRVQTGWTLSAANFIFMVTTIVGAWCLGR